MSEVVLLLRNTDSIHQVEDYFRGCSTSTKYWKPSTSWRLCQMLFYFSKILTTFNKLKIMSEVVLLLRNTDNLQQVVDYVRCCSTSTKHWQLSTSWRLCHMLFYFYELPTTFNKLNIMLEVVLFPRNTDSLQQVVISSPSRLWRSCLGSFGYLPCSPEDFWIILVPILPSHFELTWGMLL